MKKIVILLLLFNFTLTCIPEMLIAQDPNNPQKTDTNAMIKFYQKHISGIDGNRCSMYPHCSQYCTEAIGKHGFAIGWIMACDRLLRCGRDEVGLAPHVRANGRELTFDPVSYNNFWWFSPKPSATHNNKIDSSKIENMKSEKNLIHSGSSRLQDLNLDQQK